MNIILEVKKREKKENLGKLRKNGFIPAVFYGKKTEATPIKISSRDFMKVQKEAGESTVFKVKTESGDMDVLIHDIDMNPVTDEVRHVDFYVVEKGQKVVVSVPLVFVGEAPAVKNLGGTLVKVMYEIEVEAAPKDLPHEIEVDISSITDFEKHISVKDIKLPVGVETTEDLEETVVLVSETKEETEEEIPTKIDMDSIEVEEKGKKETAEDKEVENKQ